MNKLVSAIEATIRVLEQQQRAGQTHVEVSRETLAELAKLPPPTAGRATRGAGGTAPAAARTPAPDATARLGRLEAAAKACVKCRELAQCRTHVVFGVGNPRAELLFIGEAPGRDEDLQGEPFVGRAGELLTKIIQAMGFHRSEVYIANVLKCRPPENRTPLPDEVQNCRPFLLEQIELIQPRVIVALGAVALRALLDVQLGITKIRGNWYTFSNIPIMPTFHPAYLLRNPPAKREVWQDMQAVVAKLGRELPKTK